MWAVFCEGDPIHFHQVYFTVHKMHVCVQNKGDEWWTTSGRQAVSFQLHHFVGLGPWRTCVCVCVSIELLWWIRMLLMAASLINCVFELAPLPRDRSQDSNETHIHIRRAHGNLLVLCSSTSKPFDQASHLLWLYFTASPCSINTFYISHKHTHLNTCTTELLLEKVYIYLFRDIIYDWCQMASYNQCWFINNMLLKLICHSIAYLLLMESNVVKGYSIQKFKNVSNQTVLVPTDVHWISCPSQWELKLEHFWVNYFLK